MMESGCQVPAGYTRGTDGSSPNTARLDGFPSFPVGGQEPVQVRERTRPNPKPHPGRLRASGVGSQSHCHRASGRPAHLHHQPEQRSHGIGQAAGGRHSGARDSISGDGRERSDGARAANECAWILGVWLHHHRP